MNTADMLIHVHPELGMQEKTDLERNLEGHVGIDCAQFSHRPHSHELMVKYDPDALNGMEILQMVRGIDPVATMVGL
ncbi:MAG TPA: hypothetical protein VMJ33_10345 [Gallionella sp.]|nr:hypothetical protein [Gallionella sp.]